MEHNQNHFAYFYLEAFHVNLPVNLFFQLENQNIFEPIYPHFIYSFEHSTSD